MSRVPGVWARPCGGRVHVALDSARDVTLRRVILCPKQPGGAMRGEANYPPRISFAPSVASALVATSSGPKDMWRWRHPNGPVLRDQAHWQRVRSAVSAAEWWNWHDMPIHAYKTIERPWEGPVRLVVYAPVETVSLFVPDESILPDVEETGERWALVPTPVVAVQVLDPMRTQFMLQEAAAFYITANEDGIESACASWGVECEWEGGVASHQEDYMDENDEEDLDPTYFLATADPYVMDIIDHHLAMSQR